MIHCPVCGEETKHYRPAPGWGEIRQCLSCGLRFANPLNLPAPEEVYEQAYQGHIRSEAEKKSDMDSYRQRLQLWQSIKDAQIRPEIFLRRAYQEVLIFLKKNVPLNSPILEIGCGSGFFLDILRRSGYKPFGLEVSKTLVEILKKEGYPVWHGTIDTLPTDWVKPQVCVSFFVLHHIPKPIDFLKLIRNKFPSAILILAVHNHLGRGFHLNPYPPRDLTLWGERPLRIAMERAGYEVEILVPKAHWSDFPIHVLFPGFLGILAKFGEVIPSSVFRKVFQLYLWIARLITLPLVLWYRWKGWSNSIIAIGRPKN